MKIVMDFIGEETTHEPSELRGQCPTMDAFLDDEHVTEMTIRTSGQGFVPITYRKIETPASELFSLMDDASKRTDMFLRANKKFVLDGQ